MRVRHAAAHGITFGGHPVAAAVALKNPGHLRTRRHPRQRPDASSRVSAAPRVEQLRSLPIVVDVRGAGILLGLELAAGSPEAPASTPSQRERLLRGFLPRRLREAGLIARPDDRGDRGAPDRAPVDRRPPSSSTRWPRRLREVLADAGRHMGVLET